MYTIIAQTPKMAAELRTMFAKSAATRVKTVKAAQKEANGARYVVIDAGFPAVRFLVWDCEANDNLRGFARHPWFTTKGAAQKLADRHNRTEN